MIKMLPNDIEIEKLLLCCILLDNEIILELEKIKPEYFYDNKHKLIFESMLNLNNKNIIIDIQTLSNDLKEKIDMDYLFTINTSTVVSLGYKDYETIIVNKYIYRKLINMGQNIQSGSYDEKDIDDIITNLNKSIQDLYIENTKIFNLKDILLNIYSKLENKEIKGILSYYNSLDNVILGFKPGQLIILAARPGVGKTSLALNIGVKQAIKGHNVCFISLEMTKEDLTQRVLSMISKVTYFFMDKGKLTVEDFDKLHDGIEILGETNFKIIDECFTFEKMKNIIKKLHLKGELDIVYIDYLGLINTNTGRFKGNRVQELTELSRSLKQLSLELKIPIVCLCQLNRQGDTGNSPGGPQLYHLRDSGSIEQDADIVLMMNRDFELDGETTIHIRKNRNGPVCDINMMFKKGTMTFI